MSHCSNYSTECYLVYKIQTNYQNIIILHRYTAIDKKNMKTEIQMYIQTKRLNIVEMYLYLSVNLILAENRKCIRISWSFKVSTMTWLTVTEYLCHTWIRISSVCRNYNPVLPSVITYHRLCNKSRWEGSAALPKHLSSPQVFSLDLFIELKLSV